MFKNIKFKKINKGFTLIEVLLVVGFIALAGIGVYVVYEKIETTNKVNKEVHNLKIVSAGIKSLYATSSTYAVNSANGSTLTSVALNAKVFPEEMLRTVMVGRPPNQVSSTMITNQFGHTLSILAVDYGNVPAGAQNAFYLRTLVPKELCTKIVTAGAPHFNSVRVGGATGGTYVPGQQLGAGGVIVKDQLTNRHSVDVAATTNACENAEVFSGNNVYIAFTTI